MSNYLELIAAIAAMDASEVVRKDKEYGASWKRRGGPGAYMVGIRKFDRLETQAARFKFDIFQAIADTKGEPEALIETIRDIRGYLLLWEAECISQGYIDPPWDLPPTPVAEIRTRQNKRDPQAAPGSYGACYVMADGACYSPFDCVHGAGVSLDEFANAVRKMTVVPGEPAFHPDIMSFALVMELRRAITQEGGDDKRKLFSRLITLMNECAAKAFMFQENIDSQGRMRSPSENKADKIPEWRERQSNALVDAANYARMAFQLLEEL